MSCVEDSFAGEKILECFQDNDDLRIRHFCKQKVFEYFQDNDGFRLRHFCRRISR